MPEPSLMDLSRGGGCGCKASPAMLRKLLSRVPTSEFSSSKQLLVGNDSADDCAAWLMNDEQAIVSTADFFMPITNDPVDFGRIAATNAISDVYAMGARPIFALALVGMPLDTLSADTAGAILTGGQQACSEAGIPVAGGHTIEASEPIYGLAVNGICHPRSLTRNDTAEDGNALVLGKPLGVGILSAALRKGKLSSAGYDQLLSTTTQLNKVGPGLAEAGLVSAMTDVTGFGLLGHALEMCRGSNTCATLNFANIPILPAALELAYEGFVTGASNRNWDSYGSEVDLAGSEPWQQALLTDPQTSGGLLVACAEKNTQEVISAFSEAGFMCACQIGTISSGAQPGITVAA